MMLVPSNRRATAAVLLAGVVTTVAMTLLAGAPFWSAAGALIVVYACGYLVGSLLLDRIDGLSWAVIRTLAGLLLTTTGYLLSLLLSLPWFLLPGALVVAAVWLRGRTAFSWPHGVVRFRWDGVAAGILTLILLSPILISTFYMAPGSFPPVFYNVDTAYFLEKVHALVAANSYPPESLSNLGGLRTYHFGTQAIAALISRVSGLPPHHSAFLIVLPLLIIGMVAAAVATLRCVGPAVPCSVTLPLLLISTPSLRFPFWDRLGPQLWTAVTSDTTSIDNVLGRYDIWGVLSNQAPNIGGDFLILASLAGIAAAPSCGWRLPAFLIGSAILVKTPVGVGLVAGFALAEAWRAVCEKRRLPSPPMLAIAAVFIATYVAFWILPPVEQDFGVELYPLAQVRLMLRRGSPLGFLCDVLWLFLPALIVLGARTDHPDRRSAPILLWAIAPFVIVNATRMIDIRPNPVGTDDDWMQIMRLAPVAIHAFAVSLAGRRWDQLGRRRRIVFLVTLALLIVPVAAAAGHYSLRLLRNPESGHEFVDNRSLAEALAVIPTNGTIIVTNDLRYPAEQFSRDDRQMQLPALFGHQAFAVNYAYEAYSFSRERRELQTLLQRPEWSDAILEAARTHRWTHLVIRKDYVRPAPIPLEQIFENEFYAVFRFP